MYLRRGMQVQSCRARCFAWAELENAHQDAPCNKAGGALPIKFPKCILSRKQGEPWKSGKQRQPHIPRLTPKQLVASQEEKATPQD